VATTAMQLIFVKVALHFITLTLGANHDFAQLVATATTLNELI